MDITNTSGVAAATAVATQSATGDQASLLVLKKALNAQAANAATLLDALPQPTLATEGSLGRQVNTYA